MSPKSTDHLPPPASLARRHFIGIAAAGAASLSIVAVPSALLASKRVHAMDMHDHDHDHNHDHDHHDHGHHHGDRHNCFKRGTLISTTRGEVPVEDLAIGELITTMNGALPIKWIGRTTLKRSASGSWHPGVMPIRVARFALDDQTPRRDLYLSQEHSLFIDGVLIPVRHLVNERSIALDDDAKRAETIEYFCVELDTHQVIFAEGTPAETFRYGGGEIRWDNLGEYQDRYGREHNMMPAFARQCRYDGGRAETIALLRLAASRFVDVRDPIQAAYARIANRAMLRAA